MLNCSVTLKQLDPTQLLQIFGKEGTQKDKEVISWHNFYYQWQFLLIIFILLSFIIILCVLYTLFKPCKWNRKEKDSKKIEEEKWYRCVSDIFEILVNFNG